MEQAERTKRLVEVLDNMKELTDRQRLVINLYQLDRLTFTQIGDFLKVCPEKAELVYIKAIRRLEGLLRLQYPELLEEIYKYQSSINNN